MDSDMTSELQNLREERDRLRKERDNFQGELKSFLDRDEEFIHGKLELYSQELYRRIQTEFYGRIKISIWVAGILLLIGSFGGFLTLKDMARQAIDDAIQKREADLKRLTDTEIDDVVKLRTQTQMALDETHRVTNAAKTDAARKSAEIAKQTEEARKLILETTNYWRATKLSVDKVKGIPPSPQEDAASRRSQQIVSCLRDAGVHDPDTDMWYAVIKSDTELLQNALTRGANPNITDLDLARRHADVISKNCPGLLPQK
jgi:hypothetical protein